MKTFDDDGNVSNPCQTPLFKIGDNVMIDMIHPKHFYYEDYYTNPLKIFKVCEIVKVNDLEIKYGFHLVFNESVGRHSASNKIYQDRFKLACFDMFSDNLDFLL